MKNYRLSAAAERRGAVAKAPACSTCSLRIAGFGSGAPVPAAPQSSSSLHRSLGAGKGGAARGSATFSLLALASEYRQDPFFHDL